MPAKNFKVEFMRRTFNFSLLLVKFISIVSPTATTKVIIDQVLRSGLSIGANVTEAQGSSSKNEFKNFIHHAYKSSLETRYWLAILKEIITDKEKSQVEKNYGVANRVYTQGRRVPSLEATQIQAKLDVGKDLEKLEHRVKTGKIQVEKNKK